MTTSEHQVNQLIQRTFANPLLAETDYECIDDIYRGALSAVRSQQERMLYEELMKRLNFFYQKRPHLKRGLHGTAPDAGIVHRPG